MRRRLMVGVLVFSGLVAVASPHSTPQTLEAQQEPYSPAPKSYGMVKGQVLNTEGQPVSWVDVSAYNTVSGSGRVPHDYTDEEGRFLIKRLPPGNYRITAEKREDRYAPTDSPFHSAGFVDVPLVDVYEQETTPDVTVRLGPKAARLIARVLDAATNKLVREATITLRRVDRPEYSYSKGHDVGGKFRALVPPLPFRIEVSAPGYKAGHRRQDNSTEADVVLLQSNAVEEFVIFLEPVG